MTVNHDAVGSSPTGGAIQALFRQCFFVVRNTLNTEHRSRWQRLRSAAGGGKSEQGLAQRSAFCENMNRKRREPQEEADTHIAIGTSGAGKPFKHCSDSLTTRSTRGFD